MSDNDEGKQVQQGGEPPAQQPSATQAQPSDLTTLVKRLEAQEAEIRALKSGKDKRWNEYEPILKRVAAELGDEKFQELQRESVLDELIAERRGVLQPEKQAPAQPVPTAARVEVSTLVDAFGLGMDDPGVVALTATIEDPTQLLAAIGRYAKKKATSPTPNSAQAPVSPGKAPSGDMSEEKLRTEYLKELGTARGNQRLFHQIQDKYRNMGFDVDGVVVH